ncbi:MAG TPA: sigma-70 family RNA polymerase sigma factor [Candidatus Eremiobacteraceae bacterium]|nr:sigma-70 family RNA polymerase sigma factor [Candidatus Eremiobacteraceae bacterium]
MIDSGDSVVARLRAGDPAALAEVYERHAPGCRGVAFRVLRDDALAEDAVQEAFAALWRRRDGMTARAAGLGPWLVVVTRNAALTLLRADTRRRLREEREFAGTPAGRSGDPSDALTAKETAASVVAALDGLPSEQREVIRLAYYERLTLAQVSERTGAPLGTVKRRAQIALQRLARLVGNGGT